MSELVKVKSPDLEAQKEEIKKHLCKDATEAELKYFLELCKARDLNPWLREVYFVKYGPGQPAQVIVGKDAILKRAAKGHGYRGFRAGYFDAKGCLFEVPVSDFAGAWCEVLVEGREPVRAVCLLSEYDTKKGLWATKKATMIRKVALVQAHREAYPEDLSGMYEREELDQELERVAAKVVSPPPPPAERPETTLEIIYRRVKDMIGEASTMEELLDAWGGYNRIRGDLTEEQRAILEAAKDEKKAEITGGKK